MGIWRAFTRPDRSGRYRLSTMVTVTVTVLSLTASTAVAQGFEPRPHNGQKLWNGIVAPAKQASHTGRRVRANGPLKQQLAKGAAPLQTHRVTRTAWPSATSTSISLLRTVPASPTPTHRTAPEYAGSPVGADPSPSRSAQQQQQHRARFQAAPAAVRAGSSPVSVAPVAKASTAGRTFATAHDAASAGLATKVTVRVAGHDQAERAGVDGLLAAVSRSDGSTGDAKVRVTVNYGSFAHAYGGGYASRLRLVSLPTCVLTTPQRQGCDAATPLATSVSAADQTLSAQVTLNGTDTAGSQARSASAAPMAVVAAVSTASGSQGSFTASDPATGSGTWTQSSDGGFVYSYPIQMPTALGGSTPTVDLGYDSQAVDGETAARDGQQDDWIGDGWEYTPGYIQQSFRSCGNDGVDALKKSGDSCWGGYQLTLSYGSSSGVLVPIGVQSGVAGEIQAFKLQNDDDTLVQEFSGASNGVFQGAYFKVTSTDGATAYFGLNHAPSAAGGVGGNGDAATNSAWGVPVYCPKSSDPCYDSSKGSASQATMGYRFNLDFETDPLGDLTRYDWATETGYYNMGAGQATNGTGTITPYVRSGHLTKISYGYQLADEAAGRTASAQVTFSSVTRCEVSAAFPASKCTAANLTEANAPNWPDVPYDLNCSASDSADTQTTTTQAGTCYQTSPTFWTTNRLSTIATAVRVGGVWKTVDDYKLTQTYSDAGAVDPVTGSTVDPGDAGSLQSVMWFQEIQRAGGDALGGTSGTLKTNPVVFQGEEVDNRVNDDMTGDTSNEPPLYHPRISAVITDTGDSINVDYNPPSCAGSATPSAPDANTSSCYPVYTTDPAAETPTLEWFNKTTVHSVTVHDQVSDSPDQTTTYSYADPAWHRDDSDLTDDRYRTWDQFRGFRTVTVQTGNSATNQAGTQGSNPVADLLTQTTSTYAQGMDGDYKADGSQRSVSIPISAGGAIAETVPDSNNLAGTVLKTDTYTKAGGTVESSTVTEPPTLTTTVSVNRTAWTSKDPAPATLSTLPPLRAYRTTQTASDGYDLLSGSQGWRHTRTVTDYDSHARVTSVDNLGDVSIPSQETCTLTSYATPPAADPMMLDYPDESQEVAGPCSTTPSASAPPISDVRTLYDGDGTPTSPGTFGTLNTTGLASATQQMTAWPAGGQPQWTVESATSYDQYGRVTTTYDERGNKTTTSYTPASAGELPSATSTVTTPVDGSAQWKTSETLDPERGLTLASTDVNGGVTSYVYDPLGRATEVWGPGHPKAGNTSTPQETYTYAVDPGAQVDTDGTVTDPGAPSSVTTKTLLDDGYYSTTITILDGMMQQRETQANALTDTGFASDPSGTSGSGASERLVSDTFYDDHGWAWDSYPAYYDDTSGPTTTMAELPQSSAPVQSVTVFDGMGRATAAQTVTQGNQVQWQSTTNYAGADEAIATSPAGGPTTRTFTDALGRTTRTVVEDTDAAVSLTEGQILTSGSQLASASSRLEMQPGGDLVLSSLASGKTLWHSGTSTPGSHAQLGSDGNLDVVTPTGAVTNISGLTSATGNTLRLGNDGSLAVDSSGGTALWTSGTAGQASAADSTTTYSYYSSGQVKSVQDSAGNTWSATYDLLGQKTSQTDPNIGKTVYGPYDESGNLLQTTDPAGNTLSYHYDWDNRQVEVDSGAYTDHPAAGAKLDSTVYDTLRKGAQTSATSYVYPSGSTTPNTYITGVTGYNAFGKPTGAYVSIPAADGFAQPALPDGAHETTSAGRTVFEQDASYTTTTGLLNNESFGTDGGLPAEQLAYSYNAMGEFSGLGTNTRSAYVDDSVHDGYGHTISTTYGGTGEELMTTADYDQATGRLLDTSASLQQSDAEVDRTDYRYNAAGEITAVDDWQIAEGAHDLQCFDYNSLQRLTQAWTDTGTITEDPSQQSQTSVPAGGLGGCTSASPTATANPAHPNQTTVGGPAPYWQSYSYDLLGDRTELVQHDPAGNSAANTVQQVDYPGVDATKATTDPNRAGSVTTTGPATDSSQQLGYDDAGDTITRTTNSTGTGAGTTHQALTYDVQGRTATATTTGPDGTTHTSSYLYGGDGSLLEQDDDGTKTLFLFGGAEQITLNTQGGTSTENAIRSYTGPDGTEIIRDSSGKLSYQLAGLQGTGTLLVNAANDAVTRRFYDPYGNTRGAIPSAWVSPYDTRGFLNQPSDPGSGLDLLGARQYDPVQGRFLSPDPIFEAGDPSQMGGYTYAADNPASGSDPTGMDNWWADPTVNTPTTPDAPPITQHQAQEEGFGADCTATTCSDYNAQQADADRAAIEAQSKKEAASAARAKLEKGAVAEAAHRHCSWYNVGCQVEVHAEQILLAVLIGLAIAAAIALVATAPEIALAAGSAFLEASAGGAGASMATVAASAAGVSVAAETAGLDTVAAGSAVVADLAGADSFTAGRGGGAGTSGRSSSPGLTRRTANTGAFSDLQVPMQKRTVKQVARDAGVSLDGVKVKINRDTDLIGRGLYGHTSPDGTITLYPDAFSSTENLVRTIGHERMHVMQIQLYGPASSLEQEAAWERAAYGSEDQFWSFFSGRLG
ncbi:RHS repeat domain-containing protein [Actinacidiphila guanduensis]|uniref:RHS repeat domain-containing protein n=1 Tax=Actinacidiphila guanduensis TaxID=310781 RepID=UPI000B825F65|nr:RHS repeat-associated core domain-containing protein [Actinacidiphila guanduensis]